MLIIALVKGLGVTWTRGEQERRLFPLCVQVQAQLAARYGPAYHTEHISQVPETYCEEAKEMLIAELYPYSIRH